MFLFKLFRYGFLVVIILFLADILTYFYYPKTIFGEIFFATREQTPLTWVSSIVLFVVGLTCAAAYFKSKNRVWYFLSLTYLFFSMDDAVYFHERITGKIQNQIFFMEKFPSYSWVLLYFPLLAFGLLGLIYMLWKDSTKKQKRMFILSTALLSFAILLDMIDGFVIGNTSIFYCANVKCNTQITHIFRLVEETVEVIAFGNLAFLNLREHNIKKLPINL